MIEERILKIVSTIIRIIATAKEDEEINGSIFGELISSGFTAAEITEAFGVLAQVVSSLKTRTVVQTAGLDERASRSLSSFESMRMSESALTLFQSWERLKLMTNSEYEEILRQVMVSDAGAVDEDELFRFAQNSAAEGSMLSLYLSALDMTPH